MKFLNLVEDIDSLFDSKTFVVSLLFIDSNYCSYLLKYYLNDEVSYLESIITTIFKTPKFKEQINDNVISFIKNQIHKNTDNKNDNNESFLTLGKIFSFFNKYRNFLLTDENLSFVEILQTEILNIDHEYSNSLLFMLVNKSTIKSEQISSLLEK